MGFRNVVSLLILSAFVYSTLTETSPLVKEWKQHILPDSTDLINQDGDDDDTTVVSFESMNDGGDNSKDTAMNARNIDRIVVLGERHSGTTFATKLLTRCFPTLSVTNYLAQKKHWFQPTPEWVQQVVGRYGKIGVLPAGVREDPFLWYRMAQSDNVSTFFNTTLVIFMVRNPYEWIEAMRRKPYHWPAHVGFQPGVQEQGKEYQSQRDAVRNKYRFGKTKYDAVPLLWHTFVTMPLTLPETKQHGNTTTTATPSNVLCQKGYRAGTVAPCVRNEYYVPPLLRNYDINITSSRPRRSRSRAGMLPFSVNDPVYDLRLDGTLFDHPLELRAAKIRSFLNLRQHWDLGGFLTVKWEDVNEQGSAFLLNRISERVGLDALCAPDPPLQQEPKQLEPEWREWITNHADWKTELRVGYRLPDENGSVAS